MIGVGSVDALYPIHQIREQKDLRDVPFLPEGMGVDNSTAGGTNQAQMLLKGCAPNLGMLYQPPGRNVINQKLCAAETGLVAEENVKIRIFIGITLGIQIPLTKFFHPFLPGKAPVRSGVAAPIVIRDEHAGVSRRMASFGHLIASIMRAGRRLGGMQMCLIQIGILFIHKYVLLFVFSTL
jgi:hypothetical protein